MNRLEHLKDKLLKRELVFGFIAQIRDASVLPGTPSICRYLLRQYGDR